MFYYHIKLIFIILHMKYVVGCRAFDDTDKKYGLALCPVTIDAGIFPA